MNTTGSQATALFRAMVPNKSLRWGIYWGFWTLIAIIAATHWYYLFPQQHHYQWLALLRNKLGIWYLWGTTVLLIVWLAGRLPLTGKTALKNSSYLFLWSIVVTSAHLLVWALVIHLIDTESAGMDYSWRVQYAFGFHSTFYYLGFWVIVGVERMLDFYRKSHEQELAASELASELSQAQLQNLKNQLQPHFLFNAMHMILALIETDPENARLMLEKLSDLLRMSLAHSETHETSLEEELAFTQLYLDLQQTRFNDRLQTTIDAPVELLQAQVPFLTLQPLVENAIKHVVATQTKPVTIAIQISQDNDALTLRVIDSGVTEPLTADPPPGNGAGLINIMKRLNALYGENQLCNFATTTQGGEASVRIPLRFAAEIGQ